MTRRNPYRITVRDEKGNILIRKYRCTNIRATKDSLFFEREKGYKFVDVERKYDDEPVDDNVFYKNHRRVNSMSARDIANYMYALMTDPFSGLPNDPMMYRNMITNFCNVHNVNEDDVYIILSQKHNQEINKG